VFGGDNKHKLTQGLLSLTASPANTPKEQTKSGIFVMDFILMNVLHILGWLSHDHTALLNHVFRTRRNLPRLGNDII
jgi:hypothetical protein